MTKTMRILWADPLPWLQVAAIVLVPLWLGLWVVGLATGDPLLPPGIEQALVAVAGVVPVFVLQWRRPFYPFSLLTLAEDPAQLSLVRRRALAVLLSREQRILTGLVAFLMVELCKRLYDIAPLFEPLTPIHFSGGSRLTGLMLAAVGCLGANFCLQIPVAVTRLLWFSDAELEGIDPIAPDQIEAQFTIWGSRRVNLLSEPADPASPA